jgi:hypothetical protein
MREMSGDARLGAISLHQLIHAPAADIEDGHAVLGLLGEFNQGIFLVEQGQRMLDQQVLNAVRAIAGADPQVSVRDRISFEGNQVRRPEAVPEADQDHQPIPLSMRLGGCQEHEKFLF